VHDRSDVNSSGKTTSTTAEKYVEKLCCLSSTAAIRIATWSTVNKRMTTTGGDITRGSLNSSPAYFEEGSGGGGCDVPSVRPAHPGRTRSMTVHYR